MVRNIKNILSFLLLVFILEDVYPQVSTDSLLQAKGPVRIQDLLNRINHHPAILSLEEKINSYDAYSKAAGNWAAPKVTAGWWMTPYPIKNAENKMNPSEGNDNQGSFMVGIEQMIPNPLMQKAEQKYMAGMATVDLTMKDYEYQELQAMVKKNFYEWLILKQKYKILEESESLLLLMIKSAEIGYTYNQISLSRIYKAKAELYNLQNMKEEISSEIKQMNIEMNTLINIPEKAVYDIDTTYQLINLDSDTIKEVAIYNRSDIKNIDESINLLKLKKNFERSKRRPEFGIQYAHMNSLGTMPNQFNLMGMITIPIAPWSNRAFHANVKGLQYEENSLKKKKEATVNQALGKVARIKLEIQTKRKQLEMYDKNIIPALQNNLNTSLISFEHMKEDLFMTIDAWIALKMGKQESLTILNDLLKLQTEYERELEK